jgi:hypothetical protein
MGEAVSANAARRSAGNCDVVVAYVPPLPQSTARRSLGNELADSAPFIVGKVLGRIVRESIARDYVVRLTPGLRGVAAASRSAHFGRGDHPAVTRPPYSGGSAKPAITQFIGGKLAKSVREPAALPAVAGG